MKVGGKLWKVYYNWYHSSIDPREGFEERIVRAVLIALREGQGDVQLGAPPLSRGTSLNTPSLPRESPAITPPMCREMETSSTSFPRRLAHEEVDVLDDLKKYPIKPCFGGRNCKPEEILSFISIVEDFFPSKYKDVDKIKATIIFLQDKARVWFDTLKRDRENCGLAAMTSWSAFKELFLQQFLPDNYGEDMRQGLYDLNQGS